MRYVFDTSFVAAQIIPSQKHSQIEVMCRKIINSDEKYAPQLFWYEITNIFANLFRRRRYSYDETVQFYQPLMGIHLIFDFESGIDYSQRLFRLSNEYLLSAYDAAYLELADRKQAVLCTFDTDLAAAAKKHGVTVLK